MSFVSSNEPFHRSDNVVWHSIIEDGNFWYLNSDGTFIGFISEMEKHKSIGIRNHNAKIGHKFSLIINADSLFWILPG